MSNLKMRNYDWLFLEEADATKLGANLLRGKKAKIISLGEEPVKLEIERDFGEHNLYYLTDDNNIFQHVDFWGAPFALTYDMGHIDNIEQLCVSGYGENIGNFALNDFEVYASDSEDDLYNDENLLIKYYREPEAQFNFNDRRNRDVLVNTEGSARFIGVKILTACPNDEIARISRVAVFNSVNNTRYCLKEGLEVTDVLAGLVPEVEGKFIGSPADLTNGVTLVDEKVFCANTDTLVKFTSAAPLFINKLYIFASELKLGGIFADGEEISYMKSSKKSHQGRSLYELSFDEIAPETLEIKLGAGSAIDLIFSDTASRYGKADFADIIDADYIGAGANVFPTAFSEYGVREGYNDVYWELEKHHIAKSKPHCTRMWFQIDWVVDTHEQYLATDMQFDNPNMNSVVKYCKAFREQGIEVELDFGWKVGSKVQEWFSIMNGSQAYCAAPRDLYHYAKAAVATLEYLILEQGCDNVKYLTFYNEISNYSSENHYDFAMHGESVAYWASLAKYTKHFLDLSKVRGMVEIWGAEQCSWFSEIMDKMNILAPDAFSRHSVHKYHLTYDAMAKLCDEKLLPFSDGKPVLMTEFGNCYRTNISWDKSTVSNVLCAANHGVSGAFVWTLAGAPLVDPLNWMHAGAASDNSLQHWNFFPHNTTLEDAGESFYELCLLNQYIPFHAQSIRTLTPYNYADARFNAFKKDGDYTFFVECEGIRDIDIYFDLGFNLGKKLYRHVYRHHEKGEGNLIVPETDKILEVEDKICDSLSGGYGLYVYTTVKPLRQVIMDAVDIRTKAGSTVTVGASVLDDELGQTLTFGISKSLIDGAEIDGTTVKIPENAKAGDMLSVKAELPTGEYGISIIRVI